MRLLSHRVVTLPYAIGAALWIGVTDFSVSQLVRDNELITTWQMAKGWVFVAATAGLLAFLIERATFRISAAHGERDDYRRRLTTLVENLPGVVYRCRNDPSWTMERIEGDVEELLGHAPAEFLENDGVAFADLVHPSERTRVWSQVQAALAERKPFKLRYRIVRPDERVRWMSEYGRGVFDRHDKLIAIEGYLTDITESTLLEQALARVDKINMLERVVGYAAHDFNNYLMAVSINASLLRKLEGAEEASGAIEQASEAAMSLSRKLLTFARRLPVSRDPVDVNEIVRTRRDLFTSLTRSRGQLRLELSETPLVVAGSATDLEQVLTNLVVNAADALDTGGTISIETNEVSRLPLEPGGGSPPTGGPFARIAVIDDGNGMDQATQERVYEPFFTTKGERGTGLGLPSVHGTVRELGGSIRLHSAPGAGTTVEVFLPLHPSEMEASNRSIAS